MAPGPWLSRSRSASKPSCITSYNVCYTKLLRANDGKRFAGYENMALRGNLSDAGRGGELDARLIPGGDGAGTALGGPDGALFASGIGGAQGLRGAHHGIGVF